MQVHTLEVEEDINRVLFGLCSPQAGHEQGLGQSKKDTAADTDEQLSAKLWRHVLTDGGSKEQTADIADMLGSLRLL
jgi:hypothetical protein